MYLHNTNKTFKLLYSIKTAVLPASALIYVGPIAIYTGPLNRLGEPRRALLVTAKKYRGPLRVIPTVLVAGLNSLKIFDFFCY